MSSMQQEQKKPASAGAHRHASVNAHKPREYWEYSSTTVQWNSPDRYEIAKRIGRGKYSDVFLGRDLEDQGPIVVKVLKPVKKKKILRELKILQNLQGGPNIVQLRDVVRDPYSKTPSFIFEYIQSTDFRVLFPTLSDFDVRYYIYQILIALEYAHSMGIMHRDVKPNNITIDHEKRTLKLIDWGLAEFYHQNTTYNARVASRYFKGPELLVELPTYDYRLDMWSLGCMLAGMIFMREPFFHGRDNNDQLVRVVKVLGTDDFFAYLNKYRVTLPEMVESAIGRHTRKPWTAFITAENQHLCSPEALDFLDKLLRYDHVERIQALEAMQHPYFDPVRASMSQQGVTGAPGTATSAPAASSTNALDANEVADGQIPPPVTQ